VVDEQRILTTFLHEGRLVLMPTKRHKRLVVLDHVAQQFELGHKYPETEVNRILLGFHDDYAALRRYLVDESFLTRDDNVYWRIGGSVDV
jgi:hypothetical protein